VPFFNKERMRLLIGIDDTGKPESYGTGWLAREMGHALLNRDQATLIGITRHQLLLHPDILFTSQNSAACLDVESENIDSLAAFCSDFLVHHSAEGANAGLAISSWDGISKEIIDWGMKAKTLVLQYDDAIRMAEKFGVVLKGLSGNYNGVIGALAAIGLRRSCDDGRFIWLKRLRDMKGVYSAEDIIALTDVDIIISREGEDIMPDDPVDVGDWLRPVMIDEKVTIIVEKANLDENCKWRSASREYIKRIADKMNR